MLLQRIQMAMESTVGLILIGAIAALVLLCLIYLASRSMGKNTVITPAQKSEEEETATPSFVLVNKEKKPKEVQEEQSVTPPPEAPEVKKQSLQEILDHMQNKQLVETPLLKGSAQFIQHVERGMHALHDDRWDEAAELFGQALKVDANDAQTNVGLAILHKKRGDLQQAQLFYERAKKQDSEIIKQYEKHLHSSM